MNTTRFTLPCETGQTMDTVFHALELLEAQLIADHPRYAEQIRALSDQAYDAIALLFDEDPERDEQEILTADIVAEAMHHISKVSFTIRKGIVRFAAAANPCLN